MSKSFQTHCDFNNFKMRCQENIWKHNTFSSKNAENLSPRACWILPKPMVFWHSYPTGLWGQLLRSPRTASTTSARLRGPPSLAKNKVKCTSPRPPRAHVEILPNTLWFQQFQDAMSRKHMKTYDFLIQKIWKSTRALSLNLSKTNGFSTFLSNGPSRAARARLANLSAAWIPIK